MERTNNHTVIAISNIMTHYIDPATKKAVHRKLTDDEAKEWLKANSKNLFGGTFNDQTKEQIEHEPE